MWITAEGRFTDARTRPLSLRPGIAHLARLRPETAFLPLAIEYGFWEESRPEIFIRFGAPVTIGSELPIAAGAARLAQELEANMASLAVSVAAHDSARFTTVVRGSAGTDIFYDGWRRLRAALRGERFRTAHRAGA